MLKLLDQALNRDEDLLRRHEADALLDRRQDLLATSPLSEKRSDCRI